MLLRHRMGLSNVTIFEDSTDFLERALALDPRPEVVFLDIHVKPYDGFAMLEMLRGSGAFTETRVVALTASVMNEEVLRLSRAGFDGCLAKPIDMTVFPDEFRRILNHEVVWSIHE
ncbi:MAG: response regulator, partial [Anaerolineae bacterium]|nr:response regulator [Anaerolineae bacterium]